MGYTLFRYKTYEVCEETQEKIQGGDDEVDDERRKLQQVREHYIDNCGQTFHAGILTY